MIRARHTATPSLVALPWKHSDLAGSLIQGSNNMDAACGGARLSQCVELQRACKVAGPEHGRLASGMCEVIAGEQDCDLQSACTPLMKGQGLPAVLLLARPGGRQVTSHQLPACR